jgi:hypothetical protein
VNQYQQHSRKALSAKIKDHCLRQEQPVNAMDDAVYCFNIRNNNSGLIDLQTVHATYSDFLARLAGHCFESLKFTETLLTKYHMVTQDGS